jgi:hypothetical protein
MQSAPQSDLGTPADFGLFQVQFQLPQETPEN